MRRTVVVLAALAFCAGNVMAQWRTSYGNIKEIRKDCAVKTLEMKVKELTTFSLGGYEDRKFRTIRYYYKNGNVRMEGNLSNDTLMTLIIRDTVAYLRRDSGNSVKNVDIVKGNSDPTFALLDQMHLMIQKPDKVKKTGTEDIDGTPCETFVFDSSGNSLLKVWKDRDGIQVQKVQTGPGLTTFTSTERVVKNGELPDWLFDVSTIGENADARMAIKNISSGDTAVRMAAVKVLGDAGGPSAADPLVNILFKDPKPAIRKEAATALVLVMHNDSQCVQYLVKALGDENMMVRNEAGRMLCSIRKSGGSDALIKALDDPREKVRQAAVSWMECAIGGIDLLVNKCMKDPSPAVRAAAASALTGAELLGGKKDPKNGKVLIGYLKDSEPLVRKEVVGALMGLKDTANDMAIAGMLQDPDADVRKAAADALFNMNDQRTTEPLARAMGDKQAKVRKAAAFVFVILKDERAIAPLSALLGDPDTGVRHQAVYSLGAQENEKAVDALVKSVSDPDPETQRISIGALGRIGGPAAYRALMQITQEKRGTELGTLARQNMAKCRQKSAPAQETEPAAPAAAEPSDAANPKMRARMQRRETGQSAEQTAAPEPAKAAAQEPAEKDTGATIESCTAEIGKNPNNAMAYSKRGDLYFRMRKEAEAIADYEKFIELGRSDASLADQVSRTEFKVKKIKMMLEMRERRSSGRR